MDNEFILYSYIFALLKLNIGELKYVKILTNMNNRPKIF